MPLPGMSASTAKTHQKKIATAFAWMRQNKMLALEMFFSKCDNTRLKHFISYFDANI